LPFDFGCCGVDEIAGRTQCRRLRWRQTGQNRLTDRAVGLHLLFLIDMSALTDLYRVASFLGLGLSLVGIGYLYQRFVFPRPADSAPTEA